MKAAVIVLAAMALIGVAGNASAQTAGSGQKPKSEFTLKGTSYLPQRRPAYRNLRKSDIYESRKFNDPAFGPRSQGQPFDNGFFFETPQGPFGGTSPYIH